MSDDPLGPTGNIAQICIWCGAAHHREMACESHRLKTEIHNLQAENQRLKEALQKICDEYIVLTPVQHLIGIARDALREVRNE